MKVSPWLLASRPKTLPAALSPVLIGTAVAFGDGKGHWPSAILAALGALLLQIGANYANDYYDFISGADDKSRLGPMRATSAGLVKPQEMKRAFIFVFVLAMIVGIFLVMRGGLPVGSRPRGVLDGAFPGAVRPGGGLYAAGRRPARLSDGAEPPSRRSPDRVRTWLPHGLAVGDPGYLQLGLRL